MMFDWEHYDDDIMGIVATITAATILLGPLIGVSEEGAVTGVVASDITEKERKNISLKKE